MAEKPVGDPYPTATELARLRYAVDEHNCSDRPLAFGAMSLTETPHSRGRLRIALGKTALGTAVATGVLGAGQAQALVVNVTSLWWRFGTAWTLPQVSKKFIFRLFSPILLAGIAITSAQSPAKALIVNLVQNGSFETPATTTNLPCYNNTVPANWTVLGGLAGFLQNGPCTFAAGFNGAQSGNQWVDLSGISDLDTSTNLGITQTINTIPGQMLNLSFWFGGWIPNVSPQITTILLSINGGPKTPYSYTAPNRSQSWSQQQMSFLTTGSSTTLAFYKSATTGSVIALDNVSLTVADTPAPLPLLGAAAAFGTSRRLRKRIKASNSNNASTAFD